MVDFRTCWAVSWGGSWGAKRLAQACACHGRSLKSCISRRPLGAGKNKYFPRKIKLGSYRRHTLHNHIFWRIPHTHRPTCRRVLSRNSQGRGIARSGINAIISLVFLCSRLSDKISIAGPHAPGTRLASTRSITITT